MLVMRGLLVAELTGNDRITVARIAGVSSRSRAETWGG